MLTFPKTTLQRTLVAFLFAFLATASLCWRGLAWRSLAWRSLADHPASDRAVSIMLRLQLVCFLHRLRTFANRTKCDCFVEAATFTWKIL